MAMRKRRLEARFNVISSIEIAPFMVRYRNGSFVTILELLLSP
jgi:hypothetical protein